MASDPALLPEPSAGWEAFDDPGFVAHVGPVWHRPDGSYGFRAEKKHANLIGIVQGGMLMTFADRALGVAAMAAADGANCVTIQLDMQFIGAGRIGDWIEARPEIVKRTSSLVFLRTDLTCGADVVASATGVWKILRRKPAA
ncbi:PaaI family thioesterase [Methylobacterium durans]|uniref:PaaI family thioesterase n=1 Tax=Methylobacterium durans TaxID=2202825 RepID=A0A2U8W1Q0_9HYPH|nr:PaaI family thioesterase [Methylobacterium durans]AWN39362.1 PaaI family thioesterase [Methylobacterium durans]